MSRPCDRPALVTLQGRTVGYGTVRCERCAGCLPAGARVCCYTFRERAGGRWRTQVFCRACGCPDALVSPTVGTDEYVATARLAAAPVTASATTKLELVDITIQRRSLAGEGA